MAGACPLSVFLFLWLILAFEHQQPRRRQTDQCAQTAAPSENLARLVVVVVAVLGSETAGILVTENFATRGTKACWPAKHGQLVPDNRVVISSRNLLIGLAWDHPKQPSRLPKRF